MKFIMRFFVFSFELVNVFSDNDFPILVRLYDTDDPVKCSEENGIFCKISITLKPYNNTFDSNTWKELQEASQDFRNFNRTKLLHGRCFYESQIKTLNKTLQDDYTTRYINESLQGDVNEFRCFKKDHQYLYNVYYSDLFFGSILAIYGLFIVAATTCERFVNREKGKSGKLWIFSLVIIWKEVKKPISNEDFRKLRAMQGLRTVTTTLIVFGHAFALNMFIFLNNPEFIENLYAFWFIRCFTAIGPFLVQTFFLISAWLLSIQLNNILKKNGHITFKDVCIIALNRYFRLLPVLVLSLFVLGNNLTFNFISYINWNIAEKEIDMCENYWWKNLLFIQNTYEPEKTCSGITWYLATDYQLYILTLGLFYLSHKLQIPRKYLIGSTIIASLAIQINVISHTDFQGFMRLFPKTLNIHEMYASKSFIWSYIPIWCNSITYMIGVIFGTIYSNYKTKDLFYGTPKKVLLYVGFFGFTMLAILAVSICYQYENRIIEILVSIIARPLFSIGIAMSVLGMSTGTGGLVKKVLELKPLVFLAKFGYCVYLIHYPIVMSIILSETQLIDLSFLYIVKNTLIYLLLSYSFGAMLHIVIEHPFIQLQKLVLPQVNMNKTEE